jgi:hypothetical protein
MKMETHKNLVPLVILILTTLSAVNIEAVQASPALKLTIQTNKLKFNFGETLTINGTLTSDGVPVSDALIAIQIVDPADESIIYRTLNTGTEPQTTRFVEILGVTPSDELGNPKTSFKRGQLAYFKVSVKNNAEEPKFVFLTLTLYYQLSYETPFNALIYFKGWIQPGTIHFIPSVVIPENAPICTAKVYANAYTSSPKDVGYAYCPEKSATFNIIEKSTQSTISYAENLNGTFRLTLNLPNNFLRVGNYAVYASTIYRSVQAFAYTTFEVILIGDINGDSIVDIFDAVILSKASGSRPGDPNWNEKCDLNNDGIIDIFDAVMLAANAGKQAKT